MYVRAYERPRSFYQEFQRKPGDHLTTHYCPGCGHGNLHKYIAEALDDLGLQDRTILVNPVGCSVFAYYYFDVGNIQAAHGRAPAVATAVKRALPDSLVISYQGDGDLAAIGGNEILHAANRGENITVFFVNNAIYGMTGGQMAPTSLIGMKTTTSPSGRTLQREGFPLRVSELLASLEGPTYIERVALYDNKSRIKARKAVRKAIQNQVEGRGFSLIEVLAPCPTGWGVTPTEACNWIERHLLKQFPLGVLKDESAKREGWTRHRENVPAEQIPAILGLRRASDEEAVESLAPPVVAERYRNPRIKIAGFGGQGLLFLGRVLAEAGMRQGYHVSWLPSYGPEMRGGTAHCHVNLSAEPIGSPLISQPTVLIAMNQPSLVKFEPEMARGGLLIYDSSLIENGPSRADVEVLALPATALADELGSAKAANMVALGALLGRTGLLDTTGLVNVVEAVTKNQALLDLNLKAIEAGLKFTRAAKAEKPC
ncbi:MAG: 2-oxoacid:acceptor oxidoreductase family protein [Acidobacteria bacterium]|nr:2-oxoacid:acceptor oxidoreductase family protein [Acidobacteriota bacterium]MBI3427179.1 2-oxoacid:acceptor oxidoreductase family protein [Acidobacteriota bacterium]